MPIDRSSSRPKRAGRLFAALAIAAFAHVVSADEPSSPPAEAPAAEAPAVEAAEAPKQAKPDPKPAPAPAKPPRDRAFQPSEKIPADVPSALPTDI
jgi:hypothetical protein